MPMKNPPHPGKAVRVSCLEPLGLSVTEGAKVLGITRQCLSNLINGKTGISPQMAIRLSKAFERRIAICGEIPVLPLIRLDKHCRVIPRTLAPSVTDKPSGSRHDTRTALPGCGGFFIGIGSGLLLS